MDGDQLKKNLVNIFWLVINVILGFALGWVIAFGFLNLNHPAIIGTICVFSSGVHGFVWIRILRNDRKLSLIKKYFVLCQILVAMLIGSLYFSQRLFFENSPMWTRNYEKSFEKLYLAVEKAYPYFEEKGVDWYLVYEKYHPEIQNVSDDQEFQVVVANMLGELEDAHTNLVSPQLNQRIYASVKNRGDFAIISQVGYSAEMAGLEPGMLLLEVGGRVIDEVIADTDSSFNPASTAWAHKIRAYNQLLAVPKNPEEVLEVKAMTPKGEEVEILIRQLNTPTGWQPSGMDQSPLPVTWEVINDQVGYIRVDRLWNNQNDIVREFDFALDQLFDTQGIILDLRQNGGGDSKIGEKIAGRFLDQSFIYGHEEFTTRLYKYAWRKSANYSVKPRGRIYQGTLVVLTDYQVMSSAEWLVGALVDSGRAVSVGRVTGGASGNPIEFSIPGGMVKYSTAAFYRPDGRLIEGSGYLPDIFVRWTIDDFVKGIDPDILAALDWIETTK